MKYGALEINYFCPACNLPAENIGLGHLIEPFWTRMPKFFTYPLQLHPLLLLVALAALVTFFSGSFLVHLFFFVVATKYAYSVLTTTAKGSFQAPSVTFQLINEDIMQVFKQYVVLGILGGLTAFIFGATGPVGGFVFLAFIAVFAPAMLMLLVATNSVLVALNPFKFVPVVTRIGWRYFLMYLFIVLLYGAPAAFFNYFPLALPVALTTFVVVCVQQYYTFIIYHLMGYVLLQYHEEIGYDVDYEYFMEKSMPEEFVEVNEKDRLLNQIGILVQSGRHEDALKLLYDETKGSFTDVDLSERFLNLLKMVQKEEGMQKHAKAHLDLLVKQNKKKKAVETYTEYFEGKKMQDITPDSLIKVAKWLTERNQPEKALPCYVSFVETNKNHPALPEAYFSLARLLHERIGNTPKAKQIVQALLSTYPDHELIPEIKSYQTTMG